MDQEKEALFDALDIIRANLDRSVANLVKSSILTTQQGKRIEYLMKNPAKKAEVLAEWQEARKVWMHPKLMPILKAWEKSASTGVCDWCGSEQPGECIKDHIMQDANDAIKSVMPKVPKGKKKLSTEDQLAQPYFNVL